MSMLESQYSPTPDADSDAILAFLTARQHLHPHGTVRNVLDQTIAHFACCPAAIDRALQWLKINGEASIGRLRRSELVQLSRVIHRFWIQSTNESSVVS